MEESRSFLSSFASYISRQSIHLFNSPPSSPLVHSFNHAFIHLFPHTITDCSIARTPYSGAFPCPGGGGLPSITPTFCLTFAH